jgi:hypothetical protein
MPGTGNVLVRRDVFEIVGGFTPNLGYGEDLDFFRRAEKRGVKFAVAPRAIVQHIVPVDRLSDAHLLKMAEKGGIAEATIDGAVCGFWHISAMGALRCLHYVGWAFPRWQMARMRRESTEELSARCSMRFSVKYVSVVVNEWRKRLRL